MYGGLGLKIVLAAALAGPALAGPAAAAPSEAIKNLHVTGTTPSTISLEWDPPAISHPYTKLWIEGLAASGPFGIPNVTAYTTGGLVCGSAYTVGAAWWDIDSEPAAPSATVAASTAPCIRPTPAAPSGLKATPSDTDIVFSWEPQQFAEVAVVSLTGPGVAGLGGSFRGATSYDPRTVVCGESVTFTVYWIDDEGLRSPDATITASALACSPPDTEGPSGLRVTSADWHSLTLAWDPWVGPGVFFPRTTRTGGAPFRYLRRSDVSESLRSLACGTDYPFTVQWVFSDGTVSAPSSLVGRTRVCEFATVVTGGTSSVSPHSAMVQGAVTPNGSPVQYRVEYGPTAGYGSSTPSGSESTEGEHAVSRTILDLTPGTSYHYRLVADNAAGTAYGDDRTVVTPALPSAPERTPVAQPQPRSSPACTVPKVKGLALRAAKAKLARAYCRLGAVKRTHSTRRRRGKVLRSSPAAGARALGKVNLVIGR